MIQHHLSLIRALLIGRRKLYREIGKPLPESKDMVEQIIDNSIDNLLKRFLELSASQLETDPS
jgi:hypothetical protein